MKSGKNRSGFLFTEVLVLLLLVSILLPAFAAMFKMADRTVSDARRRTTALQLAQAEQETLKNPAVLATLAEADQREVNVNDSLYTISRLKKSISRPELKGNVRVWRIEVKVSRRGRLDATKVCHVKIAALQKQA